MLHEQAVLEAYPRAGRSIFEVPIFLAWGLAELLRAGIGERRQGPSAHPAADTDR